MAMFCEAASRIPVAAIECVKGVLAGDLRRCEARHGLLFGVDVLGGQQHHRAGGDRKKPKGGLFHRVPRLFKCSALRDSQPLVSIRSIRPSVM